MKPASFEWHSASSLEEAATLLDAYGDDAKILAGGQSLVPMLALRLVRFGHLVDLNRVHGLAGIWRQDGWLRIGAMTRHREVERSREVTAAVPLLARATSQVGHFQIRNRGTLGGALAHSDPAAEQPAACLALDAVMEVMAVGRRRDVPADEFFRGTWATALEPDEMLTAVRIPVWSGRRGFAVEEIARRHGDFALVGVACAVSLAEAEDTRPERAAIALFGVGPTPVRVRRAEEALVDGAGLEEISAVTRDEITPSDDLHASADYRRKVAGVLVHRAVTRALAEARSA